MKSIVRHLVPGLLLASAAVLPAAAAVIDFEAQSAGRGDAFTGVADSPLKVAYATFTGGELLKAEAGLNANQTGVYASQGFLGGGETNPITITFDGPVSQFSVSIANGDDLRSYTVTDNLGDTATMSLPSAGSMGEAVFSLPGNGLTSVTIASANVDAWNFAIDDVHYIASIAAPEPATPLILGCSLMLLGCGAFGRKRSVC